MTKYSPKMLTVFQSSLQFSKKNSTLMSKDVKNNFWSFMTKGKEKVISNLWCQNQDIRGFAWNLLRFQEQSFSHFPADFILIFYHYYRLLHFGCAAKNSALILWIQRNLESFLIFRILNFYCYSVSNDNKKVPFPLS